jgi:hypothetical protein
MKKLHLFLAIVLALYSSRAASPALKISEFMAVNTKTLTDVDGDSSPWIEIYNPTTQKFSLSGWALTDDTNNLMQWRFPNVIMLDAEDANQSDNFMVVFASGKDRTNSVEELHTNFRLPAEGGYLALVDPNTNIVAVFNSYPPQQADVSYGLDAADLTTAGFFTKPTPGKPNSMTGVNAAPGTIFSQTGATFSTAFSLELSSGAGAAIYYTTNGTIPTQNSVLYQAPIPITCSTQVRARAFVPGLMPGAIHSETYLQLDPALAATNSTLPAIVLYTFGAGAVQLVTTEMANVSIYEPQNGVTSLTNAPTLTSRSGIHLHGNSTLSLPKKSYALHFWDDLNNDLNCSPLGFPKDSDFVLYGPDGFEPVLMHNPLMYKLSNEIGRYASRTRFVEVYLNTGGGPLSSADYIGIYVLEEKIKWGADRVNVSKLGSVDALHPQDNSAPNVSGGYIAKVDSLDTGEQGFVADGQVNAYDYPKEAEMWTPQRAPQKAYLQNYMNAFSNALSGTNFTDPELGYRPFIDQPSWIDYHILNVVALNDDALAASAYYYKDRNDVLHYGPIWDFDRSQGSESVWDFSPVAWGQSATDMFRKYWWGRIFSDPDFWQAWIDRYQDLRVTTLSTSHVYGLIDGFAAEVAPQTARESARWTGVTTPRKGLYAFFGYSYNFPGTYDGEVAFLKKWYTDRFTFLDANFLAKPAFSISNGLVEAGDSVGITAPVGATIYYTLDGSDPRLPGGGISPDALVYASSIPMDAGTTLKARAYNSQHYNMTGPSNPVLSSPWSGLAAETFSAASPPVVLQDAVTMDAYSGQSPTFNVAFAGEPRPLIQWSLNGVDLPDQTNAQLTVSLTETNQAGEYLATLTNAVGSASASFLLNITPKPHLVVTEVMSSEAKLKTGSPVTSDWWELSNLGNFTVNLWGYRFDDDHYSFLDAFTVSNAVSIAPGESVVFVEDMSANDFRTWWGSQHLPGSLQIITYPRIGFSASGDAVHVWNAAANSTTDTVADVTYPAATKGVSFGYNASTGTFGALSAAGANGAYVAAFNGDIGSPGILGTAPYILSIDHSDDNFSALFSTIPGMTYEVDYKNNLSDTNWTLLENFTAESSNFLLRESEISTNASRFYQIKMVPAE